MSGGPGGEVMSRGILSIHRWEHRWREMGRECSGKDRENNTGIDIILD